MLRDRDGHVHVHLVTRERRRRASSHAPSTITSPPSGLLPRQPQPLSVDGDLPNGSRVVTLPVLPLS